MLPWPLKAALAVGLVVGLGVELGRPAKARLELHDVAQDVANAAEEDLPEDGRRASREEARRAVAARGARLVAFEVRDRGRVEVRVARHVEPIVLDGVGAVEDWYEVEIGATSDGVPGT